MFISSIDPKTFISKPPSATNTRSHSSLSTISLKAPMSNKKLKNASVATQAFTEFPQSKKTLQTKILDTISEMKKLKSVSKNLKKKEDELKSLQDSLLKSNEELVEAKIKHERSEKLLNELLGAVKKDEPEKLFELFPVVNKHIVRLRQKRNSLIIDDLVFSNSSVQSIHTAREFKVRSPYFSGLPVTTPRLKAVKILKCQTTKSTPKLETLSIENPDLQIVYERLKSLLKYLEKQ